MCRMCGQGAAALVPRGFRLSQEGAALLHSLHGRPLQLHSSAGPAHPPVSGLHGGKPANLFTEQFCIKLYDGRLSYTSVIFYVVILQWFSK